MLRVRDEAVRGVGFDDAAVTQDDDAVCAAVGDAQIVSDEEDAHACCGVTGGGGGLAEGVDKVEDLGLDGGVKGGRGFVGDEESGLACDGHGDHDALTHAAGEFVGELRPSALGF